MTDQESPESGHSLDEFLGEPTRDLNAWRWLWDRDVSFPVRSHRGFLGSIIVFLKRLFRPLVKVPQNDLWERQRAFNLILLEAVERLQIIEPLLPEVDRLRWQAQEFKDLTVYLSRFVRSGVDDIVSHNDALYSRVDQKLDRYRRETRRLWTSLGNTLTSAEQVEGESRSVPSAALAEAWREHRLLDLEDRRHRTPEEAGERIQVYLGHLPGSGRVLELGCGRGERLEALEAAGYEVSGVEVSARMASLCRDKGLAVEEGDLLEVLARQEADTLSAIVSLEVLGQLLPAAIEQLVRQAWRALRPGGVLVLEAPNPLSLVVAARSFWLDPTHRRPVHPESLEALLRGVGFDSVERLELRAFSSEERLPEIALDGLDDAGRELADRVNRLRDRLDDLVFGYQDYGLVGVKPAD